MASWHSSRQVQSRFTAVDALLQLQRSGEKTDAVFDVVGFLRPGLVGADEVIEWRLVAGIERSEIRDGFPAFRHCASKTRLNALGAHAGYDIPTR
jgi:hypothetical protein